MSKSIWTLSKEDKTEIRELYEKKLALENLSQIINPDNSKLYERLIYDYGAVCKLFQEWWEKTSQKYKWEGQKWYINFATSEVIADDM